MPDALAASLLGLLAGLELGSTAPDGGNRCVLEGLTASPGADGALAIGIRKFEAASLRLAAGPLVLEVGRLECRQLAGQVRVEQGRPRLVSLEAAGAELSGVKVHGPLDLSAIGPALGGEWRLGPLAGANGTVRAEIVDAHLLFDADVKVPIVQGQIDFDQATVEHVGPDSRMGVSRLGLFVDAPNGRSYLYQFASAPVAGVEYERRGALMGPWAKGRGKLQLQPFGEALLRQARGQAGVGFTEQARLLFERTALAGEVRLGDGGFAAPGVQADLAGRAESRNVVRLHSEAVGRGLTGEIASLSVRNALLDAGAMQLACDDVTGSLLLRLTVEGGKMRFGIELASVQVSGLRLRPMNAGSGPAALSAPRG